MIEETDPEKQDGVRLEKHMEPGHSWSLEVILKSKQDESLASAFEKHHYASV